MTRLNEQNMRVYPVIDLSDGIVVRGVAGQRDQYRPVQSCLAEKADAITIARAFRDRLGLTTLYVADLDAIGHDRPNTQIYRHLVEDGFELLIDAGLRDVARAGSLLGTRATVAIAGLETLRGPRHLQQLCDAFSSDRIIFSLDMQAGNPLGELQQWRNSDAFAIATEAIEVGIRRVIVLDLAQVGVGAGLSTMPLCRRLRQEFPHLEIITGGGLRGIDDLLSLQSKNIDGVLVASALHNGSIGRGELQRLESAARGFGE